MIRQVVAVSVLLLLVGCVTSMPKTKSEYEAFLKELETRNADLDAQNKTRLKLGIKKLDVKTVKEKADSVTVDVVGADLDYVVTELLKAAGVPSSIEEGLLFGEVTAKTEGKPLLEALNILLRPRGFECHLEDGVYTIWYDVGGSPSAEAPAAADAAATPADATPPAAPHATIEVALHYLDVASVIAMLQTMYPADATTGVRKVASGNLPVSNGLFLSGAPDDLREVVTLIRRADRKQTHVLIEVTVVEFDANSFEQLNARIESATVGHFTNAAINLGNNSGDQLDVTRYAHIRDIKKSPEVFTAMVSTLMSTGEARLISRSYMSTLSGQPATINMSDDLYVMSANAESGATISSATEISAGVKLEITPVVFPGGIVRMDVSIEDSQFNPTPGGAVVAKKNINSAKTIMQVPHGHSLIVGGMASNHMSSQNSGLPWLRFVPLANLIAANRQRDTEQQEVVFYITPYIGDPDLDLPLIDPKAFGIHGAGGLTEFERFDNNF